MDALIARVSRILADLPLVPVVPVTAATPPPAAPPTLAGYIDHTRLKPEATPAQIDQLCAEARDYGFASVCVNPLYVPRCAQRLAGSTVRVCTVVGFPLGATTPTTKAFEAHEAIAGGATELDMVIALGPLKAGEYAYVANDITTVVTAAHTGGAICKVIIETALLTDEEKVAACLLAVRAGADFVKTSTGFAGGGATVADITLMRRVVGPAMGIKASGGVRTRAAAEAMIAAGATRIGTSAGVTLVGTTAQPDATSGY